MSLTPHAAWLIFKADKLGEEEGKAALKAMTGPEFQAYEALVEDIEFRIAQIGVEAQNEAAAIIEAHPNTREVIESLEPYNLTADHYWAIISPFKGSKFEELHLSAMFRVQNAELILELAKP